MKNSYKQFALFLKTGNINCQININNKKWFNFLQKKYANFLIKNKTKRTKFNIIISNYKYLRLLYQSNSIQCPNNLKLFSPLNYYLRFLYSEKLILNNGILLHSSAVIKNSKAFIFSGAKKTGKSTIIRLSHMYKPIADDCSIIKKNNKKYAFFASPFYERTKIKKENINLPIKAIFFIKQSSRHKLKKLSLEESFASLSKNLIVKKKPIKNRKKVLEKAMNNCLDIAKKIPSYQLFFAKNSGFWKILP